MKLSKHIEEILISLYEWAESLDPHKVANEVGWYVGIQSYVVVLHLNKWAGIALDLAKVIILPLFVWLCLFFFKILIKFLVAKYLPGLKKYFHHKDESDD